MGYFDSLASSLGDTKHTKSMSDIMSSVWGTQESATKEKSTKPKNFDKYKEEIRATKAYIKSKREAFYKNNNLKER